jgi:putative DNA modification/repair radical SAM protein
MNRQEKLRILADSAKYDASCASSGSRRAGNGKGLGHSDGTGICHSYTPDGRCVSLLKILLTNYCLYDCLFCVNRVTSDIARARFTPEEVVDLTLDFYRRNYIEGLFLSSGIAVSADATMEQLVRVARLLRTTHSFGGYIHLKVIPGASPELITEAGRWADRLSANIELPTQRDLTSLAPEKSRAVIEGTMKTILSERLGACDSARRAAAPSFAPAGQTTQMVVGATASSDREILSTAASLYETHHLRRIYYSAFSPFPKADSRLPIEAPSLVREHRLYQADWLMRYYGFRGEELTTDAEPNFDLSIDPKLQWALRHRDVFPVDINVAPREMLLRIPGLGYKTVEKILRIRRHQRLTLDDLRKLRLSLAKLSPFVIASGSKLDRSIDRLDLRQRIELEAPTPIRQLRLFDSASSVITGEL